MGDVGDTWRAFKSVVAADKTQRLIRAGAEYEQAKELAENAGLELRQCTDAHYQLSALDRSWLINLFPSTFRVIVKESKSAPFAPSLALGYNEEWTLLGIIQRLTSDEAP